MARLACQLCGDVCDLSALDLCSTGLETAEFTDIALLDDWR